MKKPNLIHVIFGATMSGTSVITPNEMAFNFIGSKKVYKSHVSELDLSHSMFETSAPPRLKKYFSVYDTLKKQDVSEVVKFFGKKLVYVSGESRGGNFGFDINLVCNTPQGLEEYAGLSINMSKQTYSYDDYRGVKHFGVLYATTDWYRVYGIFDLSNDAHVKNLFDASFWKKQFKKPKHEDADEEKID